MPRILYKFRNEIYKLIMPETLSDIIRLIEDVEYTLTRHILQEMLMGVLQIYRKGTLMSKRKHQKVQK
jgi:hypothetical protein